MMAKTMTKSVMENVPAKASFCRRLIGTLHSMFTGTTMAESSYRPASSRKVGVGKRTNRISDNINHHVVSQCKPLKSDWPQCFIAMRCVWSIDV